MTKHTKKQLKMLSFFAAILGLGLAAAPSVSAWGPERTTFTMESPASYPTFNSITDNPTIGDERDFVRVGEINADVTALGNEVEVVPGRQYLVYIYFHNNASSTFNYPEYDRVGIAKKTHMASSFSTVLTPENRGTITGTITAENSDPTSVWDEAYMTTTTEKVLLHYVAGSAKIYNDWQTNDTVLSTDLFTKDGVTIGLTGLNGIIPGCEEYHGVVTYVLQAEELGGSIDKTVSKDGTEYSESVAIEPDEEVYFKLAVHNTGDIALTNAVVKDTLPEGLTIVPGSVEFSANDSTVREQLSDNLIASGYNFGTIGTGNTIYIYYRAKAGSDFDCDGKELTNTASLVYDSDVSSGDSRTDTASVNVKKEDGCEPEPEPDPVPPEPEPEPTPSELPNTGPVEIVMAIIIVLGICAGGIYLLRTQRTLNRVKKDVSGKKHNTDDDELKTPDNREEKDHKEESEKLNQKPDDDKKSDGKKDSD